jgi:SAM-dependent methyltransferase
MKPTSLFQTGKYSNDWITDFYDHAAIWWGSDPQAEGVHAARAQMIERLCGAGTKRILELGAGPGATAATFADLGHTVVAIELSPLRARYAHELAKVPRHGSLTVLEGDFYTVELNAVFDVVCCWETFGLGSDADQRRLLKRIAREWLAPNGCVLVEAYNPIRPARDAGTEQRLAPLKGCPAQWR